VSPGTTPLRIVLDVRATGYTGYEIAEDLRRTYDVHVELPMQATIVLVVGLGESAATLRRVAGDVEETVARLRRPGVTSPIAAARGMFADEMAVSPRSAFLGDAESVPMDAAIGRISCESVAAYPQRYRRCCRRADLASGAGLSASGGPQRGPPARGQRSQLSDRHGAHQRGMPALKNQRGRNLQPQTAQASGRLHLRRRSAAALQPRHRPPGVQR
jgi:hypothetical protein